MLSLWLFKSEWGPAQKSSILSVSSQTKPPKSLASQGQTLKLGAYRSLQIVRGPFPRYLFPNISQRKTRPESRCHPNTSKNKLRQQELEINELKKEFQETRMPKSSLMKEKDDEVRYLQRGTMRGASWSKNTIKKALKIRFSCGAAGYGVLQDLGYPLPSKRTLRWRTEDIHFESGVLHEVFEMLRIKSSTMQPNDRLCGLTMDEMALKPSFDYDLKSDSFIGNVTLPNHSGRATKALVFQICGITARWKQTVAYFYTSGSVDGSVIGPIVKDIVTRSHEVGLEVINLTADMGSSNLACFN